jgi:uncharacterized membrane protein YfcA
MWFLPAGADPGSIGVSPLDIAAFVALGLLAGAYGTLIGIGGGLIVVPVLVFMHFAPREAAGTSLAVVLANSVSGSISYLRLGRVNIRAGVVFALAGLPGALAGGWIDQFLPGKIFNLLFGVLLAIVGIRIYLGQNDPADAPAADARPDNAREFSLPVAIATGLGAGFVASMFGIGGGLIFVPLMIYGFGFPPHVATATSHFIIALTSLLGTVSHAAYSDVLWIPAIAISAGAAVGAQYGARLAQRIHHTHLLRLFSLAVVLAAAWMFYKAFV